eukprot:2112891-Rhodomonas_salina.2
MTYGEKTRGVPHLAGGPGLEPLSRPVLSSAQVDRSDQSTASDHVTEQAHVTQVSQSGHVSRIERRLELQVASEGSERSPSPTPSL